MTQQQGTLGWGLHIGSHLNVPWCCVIVVHKEWPTYWVSPQCALVLYHCCAQRVQESLPFT
jgi:hypothetical protein